MKKLLVAFAIALAASSTANAAIARVNYAYGTGGEWGSSIASAAASHTSGNLLVVAIHWEYTSSITVSSVTDTAGNTYTLLNRDRTDGVPSHQLAYAYNITGNASNVVTVTFSGSTQWPAVAVTQYSGIATTSPIDGYVTSSGSGTSVTTGSLTPTVTGDLLFGSAANALPTYFTWTTPGTEVYDNLNAWGESAGENLNAGTSAYTLSATQDTTTSWGATLVAFKAASGSSYSLTVTHSGDGGDASLSSSPAGINCGATCVYSFTSGTSVTLSHSESGSTFSSWSGDCSGSGSCVLSMTANKNVTANYSMPPITSVQYCDRLKSTLCGSVSAAYGFEEASDTTRYDSKSLRVALEPDGYNVGVAAGKLGTNAANFSGNDNSWLRVPSLSGFGPGFWTMTMWVYPTSTGSDGQVQTLFAADYKAQQGTHVYLQNSGGSLYAKVTTTNSETNTVITATSGSALTLNAWNFIAVGASQWPTQYGQAVLFAQANNSTKGTASLTYTVTGVGIDAYLGARGGQPAGSRSPFTGRMDALYVFREALTAAQLSRLYNSGSAMAFPFVD